MGDYPEHWADSDRLTVFVTADEYVVGVGETLDEVRSRGEWISTERPVDVQP